MVSFLLKYCVAPLKTIFPVAVSDASLRKNDAPCIPSTVSASRPEPEPSFPESQIVLQAAVLLIAVLLKFL